MCDGTTPLGLRVLDVLGKGSGRTPGSWIPGAPVMDDLDAGTCVTWC